MTAFPPEFTDRSSDLWHGIHWIVLPNGSMQSATPGESAREILRLRHALVSLPDWMLIEEIVRLRGRCADLGCESGA